MPECFGKPAVTNACAFYQCTRGCGCAKHPAFPAPSKISGAMSGKARAIRAARTPGHVLNPFFTAHPSRRRFAAPQDEGLQVVRKLDPHDEEAHSAVSNHEARI